MRYWRNLGGGRFDRPREMREAPAGLRLADPGVQLIDADGDGRIDLLVTTEDWPATFRCSFGGLWDRRSFQRYRQAPSFDLEDPEVRLVDLDGDGVTDAIRSGSRLECFFNDPQAGLERTRAGSSAGRSRRFPNVNFSDPRVKLGRHDRRRPAGHRAGPTTATSNTGPTSATATGASRITMRHSPRFPYGYDPSASCSATWTATAWPTSSMWMTRKVTLWINQSGNGWSEPIEIEGTPPCPTWTPCAWSTCSAPASAACCGAPTPTGCRARNMFFLDFTGGVKPYLLNEMDNHIGAVTRVRVRALHPLLPGGRAAPETRWKTPLPFPVQVVARVEVIDAISGGKLTTEYRYHHGYWDGAEREFRGFGRVEQRDTEIFEDVPRGRLAPASAPSRQRGERRRSRRRPETRTWFHQGPVGDEFGDWEELDYTA